MFKKILFFGRKNDINCKKILSLIKRKSKIVKVIWSTNPEDKLKSTNLLKHNYDYIFCFRSLIVLRKSLIKKAKYAAINFHPGLPSDRGIGCVNFALLNNAKNYGATAHLISKKVDSGKILGVVKFKIKANDTVESLLDKTYKMQTKQFFKLIKFLNTNKKNLNVLIFKNKNKKWAKKKNNRKH